MQDTAEHLSTRTERRSTPEVPNALPERPRGFAKRHDGFRERAIAEHEWRKSGKMPSLHNVIAAVTGLKVSPSARNLLTALVISLNKEASLDLRKPSQRLIVWPGNDTLSDKVSTTERTVQRASRQLEEKGYIMRHYNQMNQRIGFDLTGYISQVEAILEESAEKARLRREKKRAERTQELPFDDIPAECQVSRPEARTTSPKLDHDPADEPRLTTDKKISYTPMLGLFQYSIATLSIMAGDADPAETDSDRIAAKAVMRVTRMMTGKNGRPTQIWATALELMGPIQATALYYLAVLDPIRKKAPAAYFAWMINQYTKSSQSITTIFDPLHRRIAELKRPRPPHPDPDHQLAPQPRRNPALQYLPDPNGLTRRFEQTAVNQRVMMYRQEEALLCLLHKTVPYSVLNSFFGLAGILLGREQAVLRCTTAFGASYIDANYKSQFERIATQFCGRPITFIITTFEDTPPDFPRLGEQELDKRPPKYNPGEEPGADIRAALKRPATAAPSWEDAAPEPGSAKERPVNPRRLPRREPDDQPGLLVINGLPLEIPVAGSRCKNSVDTLEPPQPHHEPQPIGPALLAPASLEAILEKLDDNVRTALTLAEFEHEGREIVLRFPTRDLACGFAHLEAVADAVRQVLGPDTITLPGWAK